LARRPVSGPGWTKLTPLLVLGCRMGEMTTYGYSVPRRRNALGPGGHRAPGRVRWPIDLRSSWLPDVSAFLRMAQRMLRMPVLDAAGFEARRLRNASDREASRRHRWSTRSRGRAGRPSRPCRCDTRRVLPPKRIVTTDAGDFAPGRRGGTASTGRGHSSGSTSGPWGSDCRRRSGDPGQAWQTGGGPCRRWRFSP